MYFAARGESGAPLVFIHGAGDSHLVWNSQLAGGATVARTFALDLPGHGRSTGGGRSTILEYAVAVREFLDVLELERAIFVGTSMGGAISQMLGLEFPERVIGLGLIGTGAKLRVAPRFLEGIRSDFRSTARALVENYYAPDAHAELKAKSFSQLLATGGAVTLGDYAACDAFDVREQISRITVPTLVICGRQDKMTPVKYSEYLVQHIRSARLVVLENAGHMAMLEQPTALTSALCEWVVTLPSP